MRQFEYQTVDSTNLEARRLWERGEGKQGPLAVIAGEQTAGVGRQGRMWHSPRGGLWITIAWPLVKPAHQMQALPLAAGHALATVLEHFYSLPASIKWPNDVLVADAKIAGILCQSCTSLDPPCVLIGVGVNGNYPVTGWSYGFRCPPTSLFQELGRDIDLETFSRHFLNVAETVLKEYEENGLANLAEPIEARLAWVGETVRSEGAEGIKPVVGKLAGLDEEGRLLLVKDGETQIGRAHV